MNLIVLYIDISYSAYAFFSSFPDLSDSEVELTIVRGLNIPLPSGEYFDLLLVINWIQNLLPINYQSFKASGKGLGSSLCQGHCDVFLVKTLSLYCTWECEMMPTISTIALGITCKDFLYRGRCLGVMGQPFGLRESNFTSEATQVFGWHHISAGSFWNFVAQQLFLMSRILHRRTVIDPSGHIIEGDQNFGWFGYLFILTKKTLMTDSYTILFTKKFFYFPIAFSTVPDPFQPRFSKL